MAKEDVLLQGGPGNQISLALRTFECVFKENKKRNIRGTLKKLYTIKMQANDFWI